MHEEIELLLKDEVYAIVGAAIEVHRELGYGFLESVYHQALNIELNKRDVPFASEQKLPVYYKGKRLDADYRADFICYEKVIVELKAMDRLTSREEGQLLNYLKATKLQVGLLINFGSKGRLDWKRMVL